jgi:hypothetical protein
MMSDLARAAGVHVPVVDVAPVARRPLDEIAVENAVEGCVREAVGAITLHRQARAAADPVLRGVLSSIAEDEARHGALAWAIDGWAMAHLREPARRDVEMARANELRALFTS